MGESEHADSPQVPELAGRFVIELVRLRESNEKLIEFIRALGATVSDLTTELELIGRAVEIMDENNQNKKGAMYDYAHCYTLAVDEHEEEEDDGAEDGDSPVKDVEIIPPRR